MQIYNICKYRNILLSKHSFVRHQFVAQLLAAGVEGDDELPDRGFDSKDLRILLLGSILLIRFGRNLRTR
jgi:hypothetical protein